MPLRKLDLTYQSTRLSICSQLERHNHAATAAFQSASAGGMGRLEEWMAARDAAHDKLCHTVRDSREEEANCQIQKLSCNFPNLFH